jgi:uncharacterized protein (DUF362 family)
MIIPIHKGEPLSGGLEKIGVGSSLKENRSLLIKINLAHPPEPGHPRTDPVLLKEILDYAFEFNARCAIAEGADGFLGRNVESIGLGEYIRQHRIQVIDLDEEPYDSITIEDEIHYLPKCLKDYAVRLGFPATSRRPGMTFSNNIKLFVGAVPRKMYQVGGSSLSRPRVHIQLHKSIVSIYRAISEYAPFNFYVNGGKAMFETLGEIDLEETLIGNDAMELDCLILKKFKLQPPEYISNLGG